ncbi:hypothetical protein NO559_12575 [Dasania sp. GY-MA-18]|uniref:Transglutaminase-like domain-containing protein n=1 Tax=Dasania phycosphaerae TaxID=2950436 RepID=A0A9J6RNG7_9GAMM|nr:MULTISPECIES: transglutaminase domain-containing protein [Dasania]MCR8923610.1 hypothetical protein [Dasania sp. GY-MA-18]MCZ0866044.1 hypothetical protein [Dasania phycosphaerae]MCZ0869768.1 hypothetical protein [Dasania phycosphaerae]
MKLRGLLLAILLSLLLSSCARLQDFNIKPLPDFASINGPISAQQASQHITDSSFRTLSPEALAYFKKYLFDHMPQRQTAIQLRNLIHSPAFLNFEYAEDKTYSAQQAYAKAQGNCIAYSHLYISLARQLGLKAQYQLIESDPTLVLRDKKISLFIHLNVVVKLNSNNSFTADTVPEQQHLIKRGQMISDNSADALHYNNLAIDAMFDNNYLASYRYLAKAISLDPQLSLLWSNVGALFRKNQQLQAAELSLHNALALDPQAYPALNNLAVLYQQQNNSVKTQYYLNKIKTYRARNPYHHYNLSLLAISDKNYSLALRSIKKAIGLKADEAGFYYQQSLIYQQLQQLNQSRTALLLAIANSQDKKSLRSYQKQLRVLDQQIKLQNNN